jgi:hypothetical protein
MIVDASAILASWTEESIGFLTTALSPVIFLSGAEWQLLINSKYKKRKINIRKGLEFILLLKISMIKNAILQ